MYNPELTLRYLDSVHFLNNLFETWTLLIPDFTFDFEYRRSLFGFSSLLLVDQRKLPDILQKNMTFIMKKIFFLVVKITEMKEKAEIEEVRLYCFIAYNVNLG